MLVRISFLILLLWPLVAMIGCAAGPVAQPPSPEPPPVVEPAGPVEPVQPEPEEVEPPAPAAALPPPLFEAEEIFDFSVAEEEYLRPHLERYLEKRQAWRQKAADLAELVPRGDWPAEWSRCLEQVQEVAAGYEAAMERLNDLEFAGPAMFGEAATALSAAYRADLAFVAGDCGEYYRLAGKTVASRLESFQLAAGEQLQAIMLHYARQGEGEGVRQTLASWQRLYPDQLLPFASLEKVALALFRAGEREQALELLAAQEEATAGRPVESLAIARLRADLLLIAGQEEQARRRYEEIAAGLAALDEQRQWVAEQLRLLRGQLPVSREERELFLNLLGEAVLYDGRALPEGLTRSRQRLEERFPAGLLTFRARLLAEEVERRAKAWFQAQLGRVEEWKADGVYDQAIAALQDLLAENLLLPQREQLREMLATAEESRRAAEESRRQLERQALEIQWEEADRLLGLGRYDEAIMAFSRLLESDYGAEARRRMGEAAREAATELRREAAALFVQARRSADPERAAELAGESWRLLRRIVAQYPDSGIVERVLDNLASVEAYLEELDPQLLKRLQEEDQEAGA